MSAAVRHGRARVQVDVCNADHGLLRLVGDRSIVDPARPAATRDFTLGGMGLRLVPAANAAGWCTEHDVKTVCAFVLHRPLTCARDAT